MANRLRWDNSSRRLERLVRLVRRRNSHHRRVVGLGRGRNSRHRVGLVSLLRWDNGSRLLGSLLPSALRVAQQVLRLVRLAVRRPMLLAARLRHQDLHHSAQRHRLLRLLLDSRRSLGSNKVLSAKLRSQISSKSALVSPQANSNSNSNDLVLLARLSSRNSNQTQIHSVEVQTQASAAPQPHNHHKTLAAPAKHPRSLIPAPAHPVSL